METFYLWLIKVWFALTLVKTLMGYYQMPLMLRVMSKTMERTLSRAEIFQLIIFAPMVNFFVVWYYVFTEKMHFFSLYDEDYIESKLKSI
jgi:hypothetical protein